MVCFLVDIYIAPIMNTPSVKHSTLVAAGFLHELPCPESKWDCEHV